NSDQSAAASLQDARSKKQSNSAAATTRSYARFRAQSGESAGTSARRLHVPGAPVPQSRSEPPDPCSGYSRSAPYETITATRIAACAPVRGFLSPRTTTVREKAPLASNRSDSFPAGPQPLRRGCVLTCVLESSPGGRPRPAERSSG